MSRIGKQPINYPAGIKVQVVDGVVKIEYPQGFFGDEPKKD